MFTILLCVDILQIPCLCPQSAFIHLSIMPTASLKDAHSINRVLSFLYNWNTSDNKPATFICGGHIPITSSGTPLMSDEQTCRTSPQSNPLAQGIVRSRSLSSSTKLPQRYTPAVVTSRWLSWTAAPSAALLLLTISQPLFILLTTVFSMPSSNLCSRELARTWRTSWGSVGPWLKFLNRMCVSLNVWRATTANHRSTIFFPWYYRESWNSAMARADRISRRLSPVNLQRWWSAYLVWRKMD